MKDKWRRFKPSGFIIPKSWREVLLVNLKYVIGIIILIGLGIGGYGGYQYYMNNTVLVAAEGGTFVEGMAGQPKLINPILSQTNDVDRDLVRLVFSGLLTYDRERILVGDLAERWELSEDEKTYTVYLRDNLKWHDGEALTADDVVFTYQLIQDPGFPGTLGDDWQDVTIEKIDDKTIKFTLTDVFAPFLVNLTTGILPQHLLADVQPAEIDAIDFNTQPIGSGPFQISKFKLSTDGVINSIELKKFDDYYGAKPNLETIVFKFYPDFQQLYSAYQNKEVMSIARVLIADWPQVSNTITDVQYYDIPLGQYTAVFINQDGKSLLRDPYIKEALAYTIDRPRILTEVIHDKGRIIDTAIPEGFMGHNPDIVNITPDLEKARALLEAGKWSDVDGDGLREKDNERLRFELITSDNPDFMLAARIIQENALEIGIDLEVNTYQIGNLENEFIKGRNYDLLLFGENLGADPDPYVFWHSSQINDPGLNLANYVNVEVDRYLEAGRKSNDIDTRIHSYLPFQQVIFDDKPALFLYQPYHIYAVNQAVQGINIGNISNPADRFLYINEWYLNTERVWKSEAESNDEEVVTEEGTDEVAEENVEENTEEATEEDVN